MILQLKTLMVEKVKTRTGKFLVLFLLCILLLTLPAMFINPIASFDALYYHVMAARVGAGNGFVEPVIWQYLNPYNSIEHPMDYWMPLGVLAYCLADMVAGSAGQIGLNITIWAILTTMVFVEVLKLTKSNFCAMVAFFLLIFHGRNLFYLLTTDNFAFSAILGFLIIKMLGNKTPSGGTVAFLSGLLALLRIEGFVFALLSAAWELKKDFRLKTGIKIVTVFLLTISPWIFRNLIVFGRFWTSNTKALFLVNYYDFFNDTANLTLKNYLAQGWDNILAQKASGLMHSFANLIIVPVHLLLLPLLTVGIACLWQNYGKIFTTFLTLSLLMCGLLFPLQSEHGTVIHLSAFFYPFYYIFAGVGLSRLTKRYKLRPKVYMGIGIASIILSFIVSISFIIHFAPFHEKDFRLYDQLFSKAKPTNHDRVVSANPLMLYHLTGAPGALASKLTSHPQVIADKYHCNIIITDPIFISSEIIDTTRWAIIASESGVQLFRRK